MARTKNFDPDAVLSDAIDLFRERGYEATSVSALVEGLGVARASLYATFGGKRELYLKALDRYRERADADLLADLDQPGATLAAVRELVRRYCAEAGGEGGHLGCLVVNTAVELGPHDAEAARRVQASWDRLRDALTIALTRAQAEGELPADKDVRAIAGCLVVFLQGLRVMGKSAVSRPQLSEATEQALTLLD